MQGTDLTLIGSFKICFLRQTLTCLHVLGSGTTMISTVQATSFWFVQENQSHPMALSIRASAHCKPLSALWPRKCLKTILLGPATRPSTCPDNSTER